MLIGLGILVAAIEGELLQTLRVGFTLPPITWFSLTDVYQGMLLAGLAQLPLTATNAIIATAALIKEYWPDKPVSEPKLALNMGVMNILTTFLGSMPMCHGAGGLAGQYYFGARTGGTNIIEGTIKISLGLFFSQAIAGLFSAFPASIIGAMMFMVGIALAKYALTLRRKDLIPASVTVGVSLFWNMAFGFATGFAVYFAIKHYFRATGRCQPDSSLFSLTPGSRM